MRRDWTKVGSENLPERLRQRRYTDFLFHPTNAACFPDLRPPRRWHVYIFARCFQAWLRGKALLMPVASSLEISCQTA
ncbi:hypothetical protein Q5P01_011763 [Channa striata]|uniref:Uncharacterized protein n=1 Tax=Channa striata TaxID=64152 RepID=A0AA88MV00_CHASR|nr:hypothetical protein Q5P01_011763 [Channa striata]